MSTLFDQENPFGAAMPAGYVRADAAVADDGSGVVQASRWLSTQFAGNDPETCGIQKIKRYDHRLHYPRAKKALEQLHPGILVHRADYVQPTASGSLVTKDTMGFADLMGYVPPHGSAIAVQITSYGQIAAHLRKYTDRSKTVGQGRDVIEDLLRRFLAIGGRLYIMGFFLPEGSRYWEHELVIVTPQLLDRYVARKRKGRAA